MREVFGEDPLDRVGIAHILNRQDLGRDAGDAAETVLVVRIIAQPAQPLVRDCAQFVGPEAHLLVQLHLHHSPYTTKNPSRAGVRDCKAHLISQLTLSELAPFLPSFEF